MDYINKQSPKLIFEKSFKGRKINRIQRSNVPEFAVNKLLPTECIKTSDIPIPELSELEVVRHYVELSQRNFGVDLGFYPLGSCTMKYNPKINEEIAMIENLTDVHPSLPIEHYQGSLQIMYEVEQDLKEITGMKAMSIQPAAGAHGELTSLLIMRSYLNNNGMKNKNIILVPNQAHGTNPASAVMAGFDVKVVNSDAEGMVSPDAIKEQIDIHGDHIAGIMLTNPSTLGIFEKNIVQVAELMHKQKALLYYDGANLNALFGFARPGDMGFDLVHINLHKSFSTPHGGGGPGSGPIGVSERLIDYLPNPKIVYQNNKYSIDTYKNSVGKIKTSFGNLLVIVKAYIYLKQIGKEGLKRVGEHSVLNANYIQHRLKDYYKIPYLRNCMHEFVMSAVEQKKVGVRASDISKKLLERGFHAPTIYFPLIVEEAMMIEPTETEGKERLDEFCNVMIEFAKEIEANPEKFKELSNVLPIQHPDEVSAARKPIVRFEVK